MISSRPETSNDGERDVRLDRLADPAKVDQGEADDEDTRDRPGRKGDELLQVGVTEGLGGRGSRRDARGHHRESHHEGEELDLECPVRVERGAGCPRVLADELEVAERGEERDDERQQERHPERAADLPGDRTGQRIDACAEDVPEDEEQQQLRPDCSPKLGLFAGFPLSGARLLRHAAR